ncbi:MAG: CDP-alcohol phosphatidyltransferase family protein [Pseudomonadota bacterium]
MANLITLSRLLLLILVVAIAYRAPPLLQLINVPLLILVFVTDGLDGYVARKRNETSVFGAMFDIAGDRIVELTMWIVLADLTYLGLTEKLVPIWVPLVFVIRGIVIDTIRANQVTAAGRSPFDMIQSGIGRWIVAGKFMRIFYAVLKAHAFCWLLLMRPLPVLVPELWAAWSWLLVPVGDFLVYLSALICVARGLPVVAEFLYKERASLIPGGGHSRER